MFVPIVIISIIAGILWCVAFISLIVFIYGIVRKNDGARRMGLKVLIPSAIIWVLAICVDVFLLVKDRYKVVGEVGKLTGTMVGSGFAAAGEGLGQGLATAAQSFEKTWDKGRLEQLQNLHISFSSSEYKIENAKKLYDIELVFDNKSPAEIKLYMQDLIGNNYLFVCDKNDFVYTIPLVYTTIRSRQTTNGTTVSSVQYANTIIPFGKSKFAFNVTVPQDVEIVCARFVNEVIPFK